MSCIALYTWDEAWADDCSITRDGHNEALKVLVWQDKKVRDGKRGRVDTTNSSASPSFPPAVTPPRTETTRSRNYVSTLASSPAQSLWTAPTGKRSEQSSYCNSSPEPSSSLPPRFTLDVPPSDPANSVRDGLSDANTYYTASWGSPYHPASREALLDSSLRQARDRPSDTESPTASPPFRLDYLVPSRVSVFGRDLSPSFGLEHLVPSRIPLQSQTLAPPAWNRTATSQSDQLPQSLEHTPVRPQVTRSLTEDWVHQYASGPWRSERGNWLSDESAESDSSSEKSEDYKTPIPFTWFAGRHRRRNSTSVDSPELTRIGLRAPSEHRNRPVDTFRRHRSRQSNLTLKQEDFWNITRQSDSASEKDMSIFDSKWASEPLKLGRNDDNKENVNHSPQSEIYRPRLDQPEGLKHSVHQSLQSEISQPREVKAEVVPEVPNHSTRIETPRTPTDRTEADVSVIEKSLSPIQDPEKPSPPTIESGETSQPSLETQEIPSSLSEPEKTPSPILEPEQTDLPTDSMDTIPSSHVEKPLPPIPPQESESVLKEPVKTHPPPVAKTESRPLPPPPPRQRTRLIWKGKSCWIGLPASGPETYGRPKPLSLKEVESRFRAFENDGYNTHGFDVENHWSDNAVSQSRAMYPDPSEDLTRRQQRDFQVRVPNPKLWKDYMEQQIEAKLAALGVSLGEEPAPAPAPLSRQSSNQHPGRSFSPNALASSIPGGSHRSTPSLAHFSTAAHSHSASVASPLSMPGAPGHLQRHSVFGMPYGYPQQQTGQTGLPAFSPSQHFNMNGVVPGEAPTLDRLRSDSVGPSKTPISPFGGMSPFGMPKSPQPFPPDLSQVPPHLRHQSVYSSFSPQPSATPGFRTQSALPELREDEEEQMQDYFSGVRPESQQTEIMQPSPRGQGHRHNISEGLERDIQEAEYHLERSIDREMNESEAYDRFNDNSRSKQKQVQQTYVPPAKRASLNVNGHTERAPANEGFAAPLQNKLLTKSRGHASKLSVAAPEFKFNPGGFQPSFAQPSLSHVGNDSSEDMEIISPAFQPTGFGGFGGASLPSSNFNFSSSVAHMPAVAPSQLALQAQVPSIFGNVEIPDVVKPARRSKAVVIKAPAAHAEPQKEEKDDENGRLKQSEERQKRARTERTDGGDVPMFAEVPIVPQLKGHHVLPVPEELKLGDNSSPDDDQKPIVTAVSAKRDVQPSAQISSLEDFATLAEFPSQVEHERNMSEHGHKKNTSSLSALAKPFETKSTKAPTFTPQEPARIRSPGALEGKPDLSPTRVFSHNIGAKHKAVESLSYNTSPEPHKHVPYAQNDSAHAQYPEPTFDEIDAVMQQLNDESEGPNFTDEHVRQGTPGLDSSVVRHPPANRLRSDGPSPTPGRGHYSRHMVGSSISPQDETFASEQLEMPSGPSINFLNRNEDVPLSEWSEDLELDGDGVQTRSRFFDDRIDSIVGNILQDRLQPLEKSLQLIYKAISSKHTRDRSRPATGRTASAVDSDADDEDELPSAKLSIRPLSSGNDKRAQQMKAAVLEALAIQEANMVHKSPGMSSAVEIHHALMDMNTTIARIAGAHLDIDDVRAVVEDVLHRQQRAVVPTQSNQVPREVERNHKRAITELEGRFNETLAGKLEEANQRRMIEEREADTRRLLRLAEEELSLLRKTTSDQDHRIHSLQREFQISLDRAEEAESAKRETDTVKRTLEKQITDVESENSALEKTLEEYRLSSNKWRQEVDDLSNENENLKGTLNEMRSQIADGLNIRENMRGKLDKIHADMTDAAEQLASEKLSWQNRNETLQKKNIILQARLDGESSVRRSLEEEVHGLRAQVHDGVSAKIHLEQALRSNARNEEVLTTLKTDLTAEQTLVARLERDIHEAREAGRAEVQRTQMIMEASIDVANSQAAIARSSLEHELRLAKNAIEDLKMTSSNAKARHELLLEEEAGIRRDVLRKVNETSSAMLQELQTKHEESLRYMKVQHEKELTNALTDKQREESHLQDRLNLSNDQVAHLQDRVSHLEDRLRVAQSAAKAAAKQAQAARSAAPIQSAPEPAPAAPAKNSEIPEKVSPQALRESILVLQEQLQERETRIEAMTAQINEHDVTAPAKLKERDTEITWLRELLAVRYEDLSELIRQLENDGFDREAVRDYAIRIRAGIQMEQAEKERLISAGTSKAAQAVAGLVNVASPGAARLASAWGNWRKGRAESSSSSKPAAPSTGSRASRVLGKAPSSAPILRDQTKALRTRSTSRNPAATPARPNVSPSPSLFAGLMTPPASNIRRSPSPTTAAPMQTEMSTVVPSYQTGTVNPDFTQAAPPGFGPRRTSPLSRENEDEDEDDDEDDEEEEETRAFFGRGGYDADADAEIGSLLPDDSFGDLDDDAPEQYDVEREVEAKEAQKEDETDKVTAEEEIKETMSEMPTVDIAGDDDSGKLELKHGSEHDDESEHEQELEHEREQDQAMMAEETLGRSLAAELENL